MINLMTVCIIYVTVLCKELFEQYSLNILFGFWISYRCKFLL